MLAATGVQGGRSHTCQPDCSGRTTGDRVQDPRDCTKYYYCLEEGQVSERSLFCRSNHIFDAALGECVAVEDPHAPCQPSCEPVSPPAGCAVECKSDGEDLVQNVFDCNTYYYCVGEEYHGPFFCPEERPYFNGDHCVGRKVKEGEKGVSDDEPAVKIEPGACCQHPCAAYCPKANMQIQDPQDCHYFYICLEEGPANTDLYFPCPQGTTVDYKTGLCVKGDIPCHIPCTSDDITALLSLRDKMDDGKDYIHESLDLDHWATLQAAAEAIERGRYEMALNL